MDPNFITKKKGDVDNDKDSDAENSEEEDDCFHEEDMVEQLPEFAEVLQDEDD